MKWVLLLLALLFGGCATTRCSVAVYGEVDDVTIEARYELGPMAKERK